MSQGDQLRKLGLGRKRAEPVLGLLCFLLPCGFLLHGVVLWHRPVSGGLLTGGRWRGALSEQPALRPGVDAAVAGAVARRAGGPVDADRQHMGLHRAFGSLAPADGLPGGGGLCINECFDRVQWPAGLSGSTHSGGSGIDRHQPGWRLQNLQHGLYGCVAKIGEKEKRPSDLLRRNPRQRTQRLCEEIEPEREYLL
jgi:hypothetical protein